MFNFSFDKRTIYIIIGVMVVIAVMQFASNPAGLFGLLVSIPGVLVAITFHEFAHGYAAYKLGDNTAKSEGRLSLNPLDHLDPIGTLLLVVAGFGWGKPVEINPRNFNRTVTMSKGEAIVSIAGPAMNFILAFIFSIISVAIIKFAPTFIFTQLGAIILTLLQVTVSINVGLGVFNLIPLPPLDGSKVLNHFLPYSAKDWFERYSQVFYIVFVVLWITGLAGDIISPIISLVYTGITNLVGLLFGI